MKKILLVSLSLLTVVSAIAQKEKKYEKIFYKDSKTENNDLVITVDNSVSTATETKFKLKIVNKTNDYIQVKPEECKFIVNGKEMVPQEKGFIIEPNGSYWEVINLKTPMMNTVKDYSFVLDGLYRIPTTSKGVEAPDFRLPPTKNDFTAGNFSVNLNKLSKESANTAVKFNVKYTGDKVGIVFPSKAGVKMPDGNEYANGKSKMSPVVLMRGEDDSFTLWWDRMQGKGMDMQKVEMIIKWNDTFVEVEPAKMNPERLEMKFDDLLSK